MRVPEALLPLLDAAGPAPADPAAARSAEEAASQALVGRVIPSAPDAVRWTDHDADGVPVRVYTPSDPTGAGLVHAHGGGWTTGSLETVHAPAAAMAEDSGAVVVSVGYRLIPEHRFPAGVDDLETAFRWTIAHAAALGIHPERCAISGSSAGGNLAAVVARRLRDDAGPAPALQLLQGARLDTGTDGDDWDAARQDVPPLAAMLTRSVDAYAAAGARADDPDASPLAAASFEGLPPATILAGEVDPLRGDALAYAHRLIDAGVRVELHLIPGVVHGTEEFRLLLPGARDWHRIRCTALRSLAMTKETP